MNKLIKFAGDLLTFLLYMSASILVLSFAASLGVLVFSNLKKLAGA
jgi:hypothetical protein